ncbi:MAG TPA: BrnA antitoxin family protein [Gammaproteobacteria bacterium]|nr:BrnA antitoxin family protein [Gammaproteobacteria bacterium]
MKKLRAKSDKDISYIDNPETSKDFWKDADVFMPKVKVPVSLRLDEDIINYFKEEGSRYQSRINAVLKAYVNSHPHHK